MYPRQTASCHRYIILINVGCTQRSAVENYLRTTSCFHLKKLSFLLGVFRCSLLGCKMTASPAEPSTSGLWRGATIIQPESWTTVNKHTNTFIIHIIYSFLSYFSFKTDFMTPRLTFYHLKCAFSRGKSKNLNDQRGKIQIYVRELEICPSINQS